MSPHQVGHILLVLPFLQVGQVSIIADLHRILTEYLVEVEVHKKRGDIASVASVLASFAKALEGVVAHPASDLERLTASVGVSVASALASFAKSLKK